MYDTWILLAIKAMKINSFNEWDPLKEVILGSADKQSAVLTWETKSKIHEENFEKAKKLSKEAYPKWLLDEVNEDLDAVKQIFEKKGIKVFRPKVYDINAVYTSPYGWSSTGNNIYNIRDLHLIVAIMSLKLLLLRKKDTSRLLHYTIFGMITSTITEDLNGL